MKKFGFFVVFSMLICTNAFGGACVTMLCDESEHDVSEMLTENGITGGPNNNNDGRFTSQKCFMCDTGGASECNYGDTVAIVDNRGNVKNAWQCTDDSGVDDSWKSYNINTLPVCGDSPVIATNQDMRNAKPMEIREGSAARGSVSVIIQQSRRVSSLCIYRECRDGYEAKDEGWACMPKIEPQPEQPTPEPVTPTPDPVQPTPPSRPSCRQQRTTLNGKACCDTLSLGVYKKDTDTCECKNGMNFVIENGTGYCRPTQQVGAQYTCDATILAQIAKWKIACAKNSDIVDLINQIEAYCKGDNKTETMFMTYYTTLLGYNPQQCGASTTSTTIDYSALAQDVNNAYRQLTSIHNKFRDDVSVWKNEEGKFNTARLASDSIAGVVLGTAGGLITSSVVKKNQVENGFEDIKCTIGGQNVAEWGDQFRVGIQ